MTRSQALFVLEEADFGPWRVQAGVRSERVRVASDGDVDADTPRFGAATERRFSPSSASLGATWRLAEGWALGATAGHTERAPAYYELYANGVHVATAAYERGDVDLGLERSRNLGATLEWRQGPHSVKASAYSTRFSRFISLPHRVPRSIQVMAARCPSTASSPCARSSAASRSKGAGAWHSAPWKLDLSALADTVRATDLDRGTPLPRIAPMRLQLGLDLASGPWSLGLGVRHTARQDRVADGDRPTPSATLWNAWASWRLPLAGVDATAFVRLDNLTDQLAPPPPITTPPRCPPSAT